MNEWENSINAHAPFPSTMSLSIPLGPRVVLTVSTTDMHAVILDKSWFLPWESSVPSLKRIICGVYQEWGVKWLVSGWIQNLIIENDIKCQSKIIIIACMYVSRRWELKGSLDFTWLLTIIGPADILKVGKCEFDFFVKSCSPSSSFPFLQSKKKSHKFPFNNFNFAMKNVTLDEILTKWQTKLDDHVKEFHHQAKTVSKWDQILVENAHQVSSVKGYDVLYGVSCIVWCIRGMILLLSCFILIYPVLLSSFIIFYHLCRLRF